MVNGVAHGPLPGTTAVPASHALLQGRRRAVPGAVARQGLPGGERPGGGPQRLRPHHRGRRLHLAWPPAARPTATPSWCPRKTPTAPWTPPPASAAARAWPCARTPRRRCSWRPRSRTWVCCRKASRSATRRAWPWWRRRNAELFGSCTNIGECEAVCPKEIKLEVIARMNRDFLRAKWTGRGASREDQAEAASGKTTAGR